MNLLIKGKSKKESFYVLAQILAILSGTWMVGAGMFLNYLTFALGFMQVQTKIVIGTFQYNNSNFTYGLSKPIEIIASSVTDTANFYVFLFGGGIVFAFLALCFWSIGYIQKE